MERACTCASEHTEKLLMVIPFGVCLSSKYLLAHSSHPAVCVSSSCPIFATKSILHWPGVKMCTRQGLWTNPKAYSSLQNFLAIAIPRLFRFPGAGDKLGASSLATRPISSSVKAGLNGASMYCSADRMAALLLPFSWENPCMSSKRELDA